MRLEVLVSNRSSYLTQAIGEILGGCHRRRRWFRAALRIGQASSPPNLSPKTVPQCWIAQHATSVAEPCEELELAAIGIIGKTLIQ